MIAPEHIARGVLSTLESFAEAYARRDASALRATLATDTDVVFYGTGKDEKRIGPEEILQQAKRDWSQSDEAAVVYGMMLISSAGAVAWVAADVTCHVKAGGSTASVPGRFTAVLEERQESWLIVQGHMSFPASSQASGKSFPC